MIVVRTTWRCLICDAAGEGEKSDRDAERHARKAKHGTLTSTRPIGGTP